jgi:hypothetical protein
LVRQQLGRRNVLETPAACSFTGEVSPSLWSGCFTALLARVAISTSVMTTATQMHPNSQCRRIVITDPPARFWKDRLSREPKTLLLRLREVVLRMHECHAITVKDKSRLQFILRVTAGG